MGEDKLSVPISTNNINPKEAVKLTVTKIGKDAAVIAVDETVVVTLTDAKLSELKGQSRKRQYMIKDLNTALLQKAGAIKEMAKINPNIVFDHKIMVIADKDTPYWLVTSVLYTSAEAGFDQYNLVALRKDQ